MGMAETGKLSPSKTIILSKNILYKSRSFSRHCRSAGEFAIYSCRDFNFFEVDKGMVYGIKILLDNCITAFAVSLFDGFLDLFDGFIARARHR